MGHYVVAEVVNERISIDETRYYSFESAVRGLKEWVAEIRQTARVKKLYAHWSKDQRRVELTLGRDRNSALFTRLGVYTNSEIENFL